MSRSRDTADQINRVDSSAANATAITIDSSEHVLVGKTTGSYSINVVGAEITPLGEGQFTVSSNPVLQLNRKTSDGDIALFRKDGTTVGSIFSGHGGSQVGIGTNTTGITFNPATRSMMPANPSSTSPQLDATLDIGFSSVRWKDLYLSGGVFLGGTGSANKLTDYEFGSWTPTLPNGGSTTVQRALYTKVGHQVHIQAQVTFVPTNNGSQFAIGGIPFVSHAGASSYSAGSLGYSGALNTSDWGDPLVQHNNGNFLYFHAMNGGATILNSAFSGASHNLIFAATYITNP